MKSQEYWDANLCRFEDDQTDIRQKIAYAEQIDYFYKDILDRENLKGLKVLDAGCGTGTWSFSSGLRGATVTGVDFSPIAIERARQLNTLENVEFVNKSLTDLTGIADNTFDLVNSFGVLHHIPDVEKAVHEIHRVLKPGGKFILVLYKSRSAGSVVKKMIQISAPIFRPVAKKSSFWSEIIDCPYAKEYSKKDIDALIKDFRHARTTVTFTGISRITKNRFLFLDKMLSPFGYYWIIESYKKEN